MNKETKNNPFFLTKEEYDKKIEGLRGCFTILAITSIISISVFISVILIAKKQFDKRKITHSTSLINNKKTLPNNNKTFVWDNKKQR